MPRSTYINSQLAIKVMLMLSTSLQYHRTWEPSTVEEHLMQPTTPLMHVVDAPTSRHAVLCWPTMTHPMQPLQHGLLMLSEGADSIDTTKLVLRSATDSIIDAGPAVDLRQ